MITQLYKGSIELVFEEARHRFTVGGKPVISVTNATGIIDKSRPLIYWAVGLTKDFLMQNLKNLIDDKKGDKIVALIEESIQQHRIKKERAADIGTQVHDWAEQFIKAKTKKDQPKLPDDPQVYNGVSAFLRWVDEREITFVSSEKQIYSKKYNYAGIMDAEAIIDGKLCVVDFKTSKAIYPEHFIQTCGYLIASEEESKKKYDKAIIIRFGKETGEFEVQEILDIEKYKKGFFACLELKRCLIK